MIGRIGREGVPSVSIRLAIFGALTALLSCTEVAVDPSDPTPPEPINVDLQHLATGAALADLMREGITDPFTANAVRAAQDAIPADEQGAFVAELGQLRIGGDMSTMMANRSFRRLLEITAPIYDARFGSEGRIQATAVRPSMESASGPTDPFEQYREEATSYLRGWLDKAKEVVDNAMAAVFEPSWQQVFVGGAAVAAVCAGTGGVACPIAIGVALGWTVQGNEPNEDLPAPLHEVVTENGEGSGAKLQVMLDNLSPCDAQDCEQNTELDDLKPYFDDLIRIPSQTYNVNQRVDLNLPTATGGDAPLTYSLSPIVPGLDSFLGASGGVASRVVSSGDSRNDSPAGRPEFAG